MAWVYIEGTVKQYLLIDWIQNVRERGGMDIFRFHLDFILDWTHSELGLPFIMTGKTMKRKLWGNFRTFVLHMLYILTVVLEKTLESPLDCKEIKPINPKGNQSWIFIGRATAEAEAPILWPCDTNRQLIEKDPDAGKNWEQGERREQQRMRWLDGITDSVDMSLSNFRRWWRTGKPGVLQFMGSQRVRHDLLPEWQHQHLEGLFIILKP